MSALYFADSSDYETALWNVLRALLDPDLVADEERFEVREWIRALWDRFPEARDEPLVGGVPWIGVRWPMTPLWPHWNAGA